MVDSVTDRMRLRRLADKAVTDRDVLNDILDAGLVAHVGIIDHEQPFVIPVGYARRDDDVIIHGSTGSRLFRLLADGAPACLTVTLLDGVVYARSAFESSMNYRSAVLVGRAHRLSGDDEQDALRALSDHLLPGRWNHARQPSRKELAATITAALPIEEWSVKVSEGGPADDPEDLRDEPWRSIWAGHVPIEQNFAAAVTDSHVSPGVPVPAYVEQR